MKSYASSSHPRAEYDDTNHEQMYHGYGGFHRIGGPEWLSLYPIRKGQANGQNGGTSMSSDVQVDQTNRRAKDDPNPHDEHCVSLQPGIYWRPFDYEDANALAEQGGFCDVGTHSGSAHSPATSTDFVHADVWCYPSTDGKKDAKSRLSSGQGVEDSDADPADASATVDSLERLLLKYVENMEPQSPKNRHVLVPNRNASPSVSRSKVKIVVDEALKECAVSNLCFHVLLLMCYICGTSTLAGDYTWHVAGIYARLRTHERHCIRSLGELFNQRESLLARQGYT